MASLVWFITGCSSGFGALLAQVALERGDKVIATARDASTLSQLTSAGAKALPLDVTSDQDNINDAFRQATSLYGSIDIIVNNAGYIQTGSWESLTADQLRNQFETNVFGPHKVVKAILPHLRQRRRGVLIFIGSLSGWEGHPFCGAYAGSKFAMEGMVEALKTEVESFGIKTLLVEPGRFRTKFLSSNNLKSQSNDIPEYRQAAAKFVEGITGEDGNQPGDPVRLVNIVIDIAKAQFESKEGSDDWFRLPLGLDCFEAIQSKCQRTLRLLEDRSQLIKSTDYT